MAFFLSAGVVFIVIFLERQKNGENKSVVVLSGCMLVTLLILLLIYFNSLIFNLAEYHL